MKQIVTITNPCTLRPVSKPETTSLRQDRVYFLAYRTVCYITLRSVGPLVLLIVLNSRLAVALRVVHNRRRQLDAGRAGSQTSSAAPAGPGGVVGCAAAATGNAVIRKNNRKKRRENLTLMLVVVVSVFVVCEVPDVCLRLIVAAFEFVEVWVVTLELQTSLRYLNVVATALHAVNSSVNFLVYCLLGRKFRRILLRRLAVACHSTDELSSVATAGPNGAGNTPAPGVVQPSAVGLLPTPVPAAGELQPNGNHHLLSVNVEVATCPSLAAATLDKQRTVTAEMRSYWNLKQNVGAERRSRPVVQHRPLKACMSV